MSEGRTPTATFTQQRRLEQEDVDLLNQIVIRAQNDPASRDNPKNALLQAYGEIFEERQLNEHQDKACFDVLFKLLNPATPGDSLYHKFEHILEGQGIVLAYDDDVTTQNDRDDNDRYSDGASERARSLPDDSRVGSRQDPYPPESVSDADFAFEDEDYLDNPPLYVTYLLRRAEARDRHVLLRQTLEIWQGAAENARYQQLEAQADALYQTRLKQKVLKQCLAVFEDLRQSKIQADQIYNQHLARYALGKTADEYRVRRIGSIDEDRLKGICLYQWVLAYRESGFRRKREYATKRAVLKRLIESARFNRERKVDLEGLLQQKTDETHAALKIAAIGLLKDKSQAVRSDEERAYLQDKGSLCQASMVALRAKMNAISELNVKADDARDYFLLAHSWKCMQAAMLYRNDRKAWLKTWAFRKWQQFVKSQKHARYDEAYKQMRRTIKVNLARRLLLHWRQKAQLYQEDDTRADAIYRQSLVQRIVRPVVENTYDTSQWTVANETVADNQYSHFLQQRGIVALQMKQQVLLDMSNRADRLQQYRTEQRAVQGLRQMQLKAFELLRRQSDADAFRSRNDKRTVRNLLGRMRRTLAESRVGDEGALVLVPPPAVTPARKREELLLFSSTRLSTTPAYTPFAARLRATRVLQDIDDVDEDDMVDVQEALDAGKDGA